MTRAITYVPSTSTIVQKDSGIFGSIANAPWKAAEAVKEFFRGITHLWSVGRGDDFKKIELMINSEYDIKCEEINKEYKKLKYKYKHEKLKCEKEVALTRIAAQKEVLLQMIKSKEMTQLAETKLEAKTRDGIFTTLKIMIESGVSEDTQKNPEPSRNLTRWQTKYQTSAFIA